MQGARWMRVPEIPAKNVSQVRWVDSEKMQRSRLVENVGSFGHLSEGREGAGDDEAGRELRVPQVFARPTRPSKHEEDRKKCMCRWRWTTFVAASQKLKIGKMWTRFEEGRCITISG